MILNDRDITYYAKRGMITPFEPSSIRAGISYGTSSFGYDMRLSTEFKRPKVGAVLDPLQPDEAQWECFTTDAPFVLGAGCGVLGRSLEWWDIPDDGVSIVLGKSTYARNFLNVNITPMEPGWKGYLVIEIMAGANPVIIYPGKGIAQALFFRGERPAVTYADRGGKYQNQRDVQLGKAE